MKIPIFEEFIIEDFNPVELRDIIIDSRVGKVPMYLNLANKSIHDIESIVLTLKEIFLEQNIHPYFPYPFYLITSEQTPPFFLKVDTVKDLPEHFFKKVKRPSNKELQLLNKIELKVEKLCNLNIFEKLEQITHVKNTQKKLYLETKELFFLELVLHNLQKQNAPKPGKSRHGQKN